MPETPKKFYLTTPIYYVNARPHIGHAYSTIAADVIARRHRLLGDDTFFLTGTDEHGQKVQRSAEAAGIPPQQFADEVSATFQNLWKRMGITNDDYIRTTDPRHKRGVQHLWKVLEARGAIYLSSYTGQYCVSEEMFVDGPPGTIGPDGKPTETVTEENYFFKLSEYQLPLINLIESGELHIQPETSKNEILSFLRGNVNEVMAVASQYAGDFHEEVGKLSEEELLKFALDSDELALSNAKIPYVPGALRDLSISRTTFDWGIPVPGNPKHVIYVWLDALANYITAVGYGAEDRDDLTPEQKQTELAKFEKYWPADLHLVGKEITRFHCVYWPAFLMAARLRLPKSVVANGWLLFEESKMSKSRGNVVRTETILDAFGNEVYAKQFPESTKAERDLFAADVLRYFLLREIPFGQDGSFSFDALITRYNADLANGFGNLVSRVLTMIQKYFDGVIPCPPPESTVESNVRFEYSDEDEEIEVFEPGTTEVGNLTEMLRKVFDPFFDRADFSQLLTFTDAIIRNTDGYITKRAPWKVASTDDRDQLSEILYASAAAVRIVTGLLYPFLPSATSKVWAQLGLGDIEVAAAEGRIRNLEWRGLEPGTKLGPLAPIFPRADKGLAQIMTDMENPATPPAPEPADDPSAPTAEALNAANPATAATSTDHLPLTTDHSPLITIDDFAKVDLRVAQIVVAERIPKADKLLRLEVDLGPNFPRRQILAGIAEHYAPEALIGRKVVIVANLAPRKMRGLESQGMIVAASLGDHGRPSLAGFLEDVELGARLK